METLVMRHFIMYYVSHDNIFKGQIHISAMTVSEAQDKFFKWLRDQHDYAHLWSLEIKLVEIECSL
jgi:hypothetical protein